MKISQAGLNLIKEFEGFSAHPIKCVSTERYWTWGYGHYGSDVPSIGTISREKAEELLKKDVEYAEKQVGKYDGKYKWSQSEFDALVSFCYNVGNVNGLTSNGARSREEIADAFSKYVKSGGKTLPGLVNRRKKERELFLSGQKKEKNYDDYLKAVSDTLAGKYGSGDARKKKLAAAGFKYSVVQEVINVLVEGVK